MKTHKIDKELGRKNGCDKKSLNHVRSHESDGSKLFQESSWFEFRLENAIMLNLLERALLSNLDLPDLRD